MSAQAPRLDIITENAAENVRRLQARDLGAALVQAIFRLAKQATLHSLDNQAVVRQVEDTTNVINDYGQRTDQNVSILFAHGSIFVGGQLLKANRMTYDGAVELGEILKKFGYSELAIAKNCTSQDLFAFVAALAEATRSNKAQVLEKPSARVRLRAVADTALKRNLQGDVLVLFGSVGELVEVERRVRVAGQQGWNGEAHDILCHAFGGLLGMFHRFSFLDTVLK